MSSINLSDSPGWKLIDTDQDVRGFEVLDAQGGPIGATVQEMIIETDDKRVEAILLTNGATYAASHIEIFNGTIRLKTVNSSDPHAGSPAIAEHSEPPLGPWPPGLDGA
jgi:hypothetical protein